MQQSTLTSIKLLLTAKELAYKEVTTRAESGSSGHCLVGGHKTTDVSWDTRFQLPIKKSLFAPRTVRHGNKLPQEVVLSLSSGVLQTRLGKPWVTWPDFNTNLFLGRGLDQDTSWGIFQPEFIVWAYNLWQKYSQFILKERNKVRASSTTVKPKKIQPKHPISMF